MGVYKEGLTGQACPGYMNWRAGDYRGGRAWYIILFVESYWAMK